MCTPCLSPWSSYQRKIQSDFLHTPDFIISDKIYATTTYLGLFQHILVYYPYFHFQLHRQCNYMPVGHLNRKRHCWWRLLSEGEENG